MTRRRKRRGLLWTFSKTKPKFMAKWMLKVDIIFGEEPACKALDNFHGYSPADNDLIGVINLLCLDA